MKTRSEIVLTALLLVSRSLGSASVARATSVTGGGTFSILPSWLPGIRAASRLPLAPLSILPHPIRSPIAGEGNDRQTRQGAERRAGETRGVDLARHP